MHTGMHTGTSRRTLPLRSAALQCPRVVLPEQARPPLCPGHELWAAARVVAVQCASGGLPACARSCPHRPAEPVLTCKSCLRGFFGGCWPVHVTLHPSQTQAALTQRWVPRGAPARLLLRTCVMLSPAGCSAGACAAVGLFGAWLLLRLLHLAFAAAEVALCTCTGCVNGRN